MKAKNSDLFNKKSTDMEKNLLTRNEAQQIAEIFARFGVNAVDCDFSEWLQSNFDDYFMNEARVVAFLTDAATKVSDVATKNAINGFIAASGNVSRALANLLFNYHALDAISQIAIRASDTLEEEES